jgi:hypothetical protein
MHTTGDRCDNIGHLIVQHMLMFMLQRLPVPV